MREKEVRRRKFSKKFWETGYEIDSTGVSDNFVSVEKLVKSFLHNEENKRRERIEILDWVKKELSD